MGAAVGDGDGGGRVGDGDEVGVGDVDGEVELEVERRGFEAEEFSLLKRIRKRGRGMSGNVFFSRGSMTWKEYAALIECLLLGKDDGSTQNRRLLLEKTTVLVEPSSFPYYRFYYCLTTSPRHQSAANKNKSYTSPAISAVH